jgi:hypothetical protein
MIVSYSIRGGLIMGKLLMMLVEFGLIYIGFTLVRDNKELYEKNIWKPYNVRARYGKNISIFGSFSLIMIIVLVLTFIYL